MRLSFVFLVSTILVSAQVCQVATFTIKLSSLLGSRGSSSLTEKLKDWMAAKQTAAEPGDVDAGDTDVDVEDDVDPSGDVQDEVPSTSDTKRYIFWLKHRPGTSCKSKFLSSLIEKAKEHGGKFLEKLKEKYYKSGGGKEQMGGGKHETDPVTTTAFPTSEFQQ